MTIELAHAHSFSKPWGVADARPWMSAGPSDGGKIGEIWYERSAFTDTAPSLLLKLLFTNEPLSIQVHPDDAYARSIGLPNGKTEAWYVLSAAPDAKVALGLKHRLTAEQLRHAIDDGSISGLVAWQEVRPGATIFVSAGTIHAIGRGNSYFLYALGGEESDQGNARQERGLEEKKDARTHARTRAPRRLLTAEERAFPGR